MDEQTTLACAERAALDGDDARFAQLLSEASSFGFLCGDPVSDEPPPTDVFQSIMRLIESPAVKSMIRSHDLFVYIQSEWQRFSVEQRERLFDLITRQFGHYRDELSQLTAAELLGKYYCNRAALIALNEATGDDSDATAAFAAYGIGWVARRANDAELKHSAATSLQRLASHESALVRAEATGGLRRLDKDKGQR